MKKTYSIPEIDISEFMAENVVTSSGTVNSIIESNKNGKLTIDGQEKTSNLFSLIFD